MNSSEHDLPSHDPESQESQSLLGFVAVGMALASLVAGWIMPINDDDTFYLHSWWLYAQGYVAYRDFYGVFPGLWLLLAPAAWLPWTPSTWLAFGRALVAGTFGISFWLVGRLVRAYRWEALLLAAMALVVMVRTEWFLFRRAYFEALFLVIHLWLLAKLWNTTHPGWIAGVAGWAIGTMCMISQRGAFYLHLQPIVMLWVFWGQWRILGRATIGWILGGLLAALPTAIYLTVHNLWIDAWQWEVVFPGTLGWTRPMWLTPKTLLWISMGLVGIVGVLSDRRLSRSGKQFLVIAWLAILVATILNFAPLHYSETIFQLLTAGMLVVAARAGLDRISLPPRLRSVAGVGLTGLGWIAAWWLITMVCFPVPWTLARHVHTQQITVLDWLAQVSGGEPVMAIDPYHPMLVPNATFLRGAWQYGYWVQEPMLRARLANLSEHLLQTRPPVIQANPWPGPRHTRGRDMIAWMELHGIFTAGESASLRQMLQQEYIQIRFPQIAWAPLPSGLSHPGDTYRGFYYGDTFWIRRDRFEACPLPEGLPYIVQKPTPAEKKPQPVGGPSP